VCRMAPFSVWWMIATGRGPRWANEELGPVSVLASVVAGVWLLRWWMGWDQCGVGGVGVLVVMLWCVTVAKLADDFEEIGWFSSKGAKRRFELDRKREKRERDERWEVEQKWKWNGMTRVKQERARAERARVRAGLCGGGHDRCEGSDDRGED